HLSIEVPKEKVAPEENRQEPVAAKTEKPSLFVKFKAALSSVRDRIVNAWYNKASITSRFSSNKKVEIVDEKFIEESPKKDEPKQGEIKTEPTTVKLEISKQSSSEEAPSEDPLLGVEFHFAPPPEQKGNVEPNFGHEHPPATPV